MIGALGMAKLESLRSAEQLKTKHLRLLVGVTCSLYQENGNSTIEVNKSLICFARRVLGL